MLHPVGPLPPAVYWRRRILLVAPFVLIGLTVYVIVTSGGSHNAANPPTTTPPTVTTPATGAGTDTGGTIAPVTDPGTGAGTGPATNGGGTDGPAATGPATGSGPATATGPATGAAGPVTCTQDALQIAAETGAESYSVGDQPDLVLQVTNISQQPCVADLSDPQIEILVYNGASRVWGSQDCLVTPGASPEVLPVGEPVRRTITWSGLSSQPACAGQRQRVGPGTYTVHARLSGQEGATATLTITS